MFFVLLLETDTPSVVDSSLKLPDWLNDFWEDPINTMLQFKYKRRAVPILNVDLGFSPLNVLYPFYASLMVMINVPIVVYRF